MSVYGVVYCSCTGTLFYGGDVSSYITIYEESANELVRAHWCHTVLWASSARALTASS